MPEIGKTKKCPFCAEEILADAIKCRYCREFLDGRPRQPWGESQPSSVPPTASAAATPGLPLSGKQISRIISVLAVGALLFAFPDSPGRRWISGLMTTRLKVEFNLEDVPRGSKPEDMLRRTAAVLKNRVEKLTGKKVSVRPDGNSVTIEVQGGDDVDALKAVIQRRGVMDLRLVDDSPAAESALIEITKRAVPAEGAGLESVDRALAALDSKLVPAGDECLAGMDGSSLYLVSKKAQLTGDLLNAARVETGGDYGRPVVAFRFNPVGAAKLLEITKANIGKNLAIVADGHVYSAPVIKGPIQGGSGIIEGEFTVSDARDFAIVLGSGALPMRVKSITAL